jgi:uncharacterized protein YwgA
MPRESDVALLISTIYFSDGQVKGRKRLQKTVCVLKHNYKVPFQFEFKPYFYGPYSESLTEAMSVLEAVGLVKEQKEKLPSNVYQYNYFLTDKGKKIAKELVEKGPRTSNLFHNLKSSVQKISELNISELVSIAKSSIP